MTFCRLHMKGLCLYTSRGLQRGATHFIPSICVSVYNLYLGLQLLLTHKPARRLDYLRTQRMLALDAVQLVEARAELGYLDEPLLEVLLLLLEREALLSV